MKRSALRAAIGSVYLAIALVCGLVLSGCSKEPSAEELIRQDISDTLDRVKDLDDATVEELKEAMTRIARFVDKLRSEEKDKAKER